MMSDKPQRSTQKGVWHDTSTDPPTVKVWDGEKWRVRSQAYAPQKDAQMIWNGRKWIPADHVDLCIPQTYAPYLVLSKLVWLRLCADARSKGTDPASVINKHLEGIYGRGS